MIFFPFMIFMIILNQFFKDTTREDNQLVWAPSFTEEDDEDF